MTTDTTDLSTDPSPAEIDAVAAIIAEKPDCTELFANVLSHAEASDADLRAQLDSDFYTELAMPAFIANRDVARLHVTEWREKACQVITLARKGQSDALDRLRAEVEADGETLSKLIEITGRLIGTVMDDPAGYTLDDCVDMLSDHEREIADVSWLSGLTAERERADCAEKDAARHASARSRAEERAERAEKSRDRWKARATAAEAERDAALAQVRAMREVVEPFRRYAADLLPLLEPTVVEDDTNIILGNDVDADIVLTVGDLKAVAALSTPAPAGVPIPTTADIEAWVADPATGPRIEAALEHNRRHGQLGTAPAAAPTDAPATVAREVVEALAGLLDGMDCSDYGEVGIDAPEPLTHQPGRKCPVCIARDALTKARASGLTEGGDHDASR